jgi:immunoglobulin-binding protein 1
MSHDLQEVRQAVRAQQEGELSESRRVSAHTRAIALLQRARASGLLPSASEGLEGMPTASLALLPLAAHAATLDAPGRPQHASDALWEFAHQCNSLSLFSALSESLPPRDHLDQPRSDAEARSAKVARFKRKRHLSQRISDLQAALGRSTPPAPGEDDDAPDDDDRLRELALDDLELSALSAVDDARTLASEAHMRALREQSDEHEHKTSDYEDASRARKPSAVTITPADTAKAPRAQARSGLFQQYHRQPSMTVEEFGEMHMAQMASQQKDSSGTQHQQGEGNDIEGDAEARRMRDWDEFKDNNPRGSGNSKLRPCA